MPWASMLEWSMRQGSDDRGAWAITGDAGPGQRGVSGGELLPSGPQSSAF